MTLSLCEVDNPRTGRLAPPLHEQKREASVATAEVCHCQGVSSASHATKSTGELVARHSHKRKTSRNRECSQERQLANERIRAVKNDVRDFPIFRRTRSTSCGTRSSTASHGNGFPKS